MTWDEIKLAALKKIDPSISSLATARTTKDYLNAIIPATNRGLQDLLTAGKFMTKEINITTYDVTNLLPMEEKTYQHTNFDISFSAEKAKSAYFEVTGKGKVELFVDGLKIKEYEFNTNDYEEIRWLIPEGEVATINFTGDYPYQFRNVAMYDTNFETEEEIWPCNKKRRYDLKEYAKDFYKLAADDLVLEKDGAYTKYKDYTWEAPSTLILDSTVQGNYKIHYYAYPEEITEDTPGETELSLDPELAAILPVYIAAELYEDDDQSTAFYFREQYMEAKARLIPNIKQGKPEFKNVWGW